MDHYSTAPLPDSAPGASRARADVEAQRERLRTELLAAAEQEAASILEDARREITVTARRAHRDLLLIRAQLRLCGIDPGQIGASGLDPSYLEAQAASETRDLAVPGSTSLLVHEAPLGVTPERPFARTLMTPAVVAAAAVAIVVTGGAVGWMYAGPSRTSVTPPAAQSGSAPVATATAPARSPAQKPNASSAPVRLQTTRQVWMRVDVDGSGDVGRMYAAGETRELNPRRAVSIRAGDAGAVLLAVHGGPLTALGPNGQVITRRISLAADAAPAPPAATPASPPPAAAAPPNVAPAPITTASAERSLPEPVKPSAQPPALAAPAPSPAVAAPAPVVTPPSRPVEADQQAVMSGHSQWLDAYARGDQRTMATLTVEGFSVRDERSGRAGSPPAGIVPAQVSDVRIDVAGAGAVLTARLRTSVDGVVSESLLSEVWVRRDMQRWGLMGVRITPVDKLPGAIR
jgi:hypothetical protein